MPSLAGLVSLLLLWAPDATSSIHWEGPPECGNTAAIRRSVAELVNTPHARPVDARGVVERLTGGAYRLRLEIASEDGPAVVRTVEDPSCEALIDAGALMVAIAVQPELGLSDALPDTDEEPQPSPSPSETDVDLRCPPPPPADPPPTIEPPVPDSPPEPSPPPAMAPKNRWSLAAEAGVSTHVVTPLTVVVGGRASWVRQAWRVDVGGYHDLSRSVNAEEFTTVRVALTRAQVAGCWAFRRERFSLPLCVGASFGGLTSNPVSGTLASTREVQFWGAATAAIGSAFHWSSGFGLTFEAVALVPFVRPSLWITSPTEQFRIYRSPVAGGTFRIGIDFRVP